MPRLLHTVAGICLASVALSSSFAPRQDGASPCAAVSASVAAQGSSATPTVPAELAYECITSVPFNQSAALELVDGFVPYLKWQSNTAWIKDPPVEYAEKVQPGYDVWGELQKIRSKVLSGEYKNEYEFGWDLYTITQATHDGHFTFMPDVIANVFGFARPVPIVSVSADGQELPKVYVYADILAESFSNTTQRHTSSAIIKINGQDVNEFLENWAQISTLQDRDTLYNLIFYQLASVSLGPFGGGIGTFAGAGRGRFNYPGPTTELTFQNGTSRKYENYASVLVPFTGISDGSSLYKLWLSGPNAMPTPTPSNTPSPTPTPSTPAPGYPPPVVRERRNLIGGYYLEDEYSDVAVLSAPSFAGGSSFQSTATAFLAAAKAAGKKRLIIDVQNNGGGWILLGYDLYKILFPNNIDHAAADRIRVSESTKVLGERFSQLAQTFPRVYLTNATENQTLDDLNAVVGTAPHNYQNDINVNLQNFDSWEEKVSGVQQKGDSFTNLFRWNLSDVLLPFYTDNFFIHGYGPLANYTEQPFAAEDVVIVTDGVCASTCTIFSELMRQRAGIKHISLGGRSRKGITQAVGGVRGTNVWEWSYIQFLAMYTSFTLNSTEEEGAALLKTELGDFQNNTVFERSAIDWSPTVNFRDAIRDGDESNVPLQFKYEEADCRILYTKPMTVDVTAIWKAVADTTWGGVNHCFAGEISGTGTKKIVKRDLNVQEKALSRRMHAWRRDLSVEDYPLEVYPDLRNKLLRGDGIMYP